MSSVWRCFFNLSVFLKTDENLFQILISKLCFRSARFTNMLKSFGAQVWVCYYIRNTSTGQVGAPLSIPGPSVCLLFIPLTHLFPDCLCFCMLRLYFASRLLVLNQCQQIKTTVMYLASSEMLTWCKMPQQWIRWLQFFPTAYTRFQNYVTFFQNSTHNSPNCTHKMQNASHLLQNVTLHSKCHKHMSEWSICIKWQTLLS